MRRIEYSDSSGTDRLSELLNCLMGLIGLLLLFSNQINAVEISEIRPFAYSLHSHMKYGAIHLQTKIKTFHPAEKIPLPETSSSDSKLTVHALDSRSPQVGYEIILKGTRGLPIFGLGEQYSHLLLNGKQPFVITEEQGIGRGDRKLSRLTRLIGISGNEFTSYCPIPILYIGNQYALVIEDLEYARFDLSREDEIHLYVFDQKVKLVQFRQDQLSGLVKQITARYGRMHHLPDWAFGTCIGLQGGSRKVAEKLAQAKQFNHPVTSVWIQDWVGRRKTRLGSQLYWQWMADTVSYPDFSNWVKQLKDSGIQVLGYVNPFLALEGPLTREALSKNYVVKDSKGQPYRVHTGGFPAYMLDLTHPEAVRWIKDIIQKNMIDAGLSGWMADFGEWLPLDAKLYNGKQGMEYHNQYTVDWARINREVIEANPNHDQLMFFNRSGALHTPNWSTMMWCGDQMVYDEKHDGMPSAINALITSGISGIQLNHADIGGYAGTNNIFIKIKRSESLLKRWIAWSAFTPFFRTHEGLIPDQFAQVYDNDTLASYFARYGRIHLKLKPYLEHLLTEARDSGYPLIRPLFFHYPDQKESYQQQYTYLLGDELLVVPDIRLKEQQSYYLPKGNWIDLIDSKEVSGAVELSRTSFKVYALKGGKYESLFRTLFREEN